MFRKIVVDALRLAVDAADERPALPCGFLFLHDVKHHAAHGGAGLCALFVVHEMYDGHTAHRPSMTARNATLTSDNSPAAFSKPMTCTFAHVGKDGEAVDVAADALELAEQFFFARR